MNNAFNLFTQHCPDTLENRASALAEDAGAAIARTAQRTVNKVNGLTRIIHEGRHSLICSLRCGATIQPSHSTILKAGIDMVSKPIWIISLVVWARTNERQMFMNNAG